MIASVEEELGYKLPAAYIWLMKQHNGGIPVNTCYPCDEPTCWSDDHVVASSSVVSMLSDVAEARNEQVLTMAISASCGSNASS